MKRLKSTQSGFTLIEIMVAVSIFAMVMVIAIGAVLSIVSANRKAAALNSVITNLNFAIEGMVRDLRTGTSYNCGSLTSGNGNCAAGSGTIGHMSAQYGTDVGYGKGDNCSLEEPGCFCPNGIYKVITEGGSPESFCLTGPDIRVNQLQFFVTGAGAGDYVQPKVIVVINGNFIGYGAFGDFSLQSMVTQRKLDI